MKKKNHRFIILSTVLSVLCLSGCANTVNTAEATTPPADNQTAVSPLSETYSVIQDTDFGSAFLATSNEDFLNAGFQLGDSLDVTFSNGKKLEDIPLFDGYYVKTNMPLVVTYPGYQYTAVAYSNGAAMWDTMELTPENTAEVTLHEAGKYLTVQETLSTVYTDNREDYGEDYVFANFRSLSGGSLKENTFYRGASSIDNEHNRAGTVDKLIREVGIRYDFDLSDSEKEVNGFIESNPDASGYLFCELMDEGNVGFLNLSAAYRSKDYTDALTAGIREMMKHEGPYYIHCVEGKDRTGFACIIFEALCGASYDELEEDYMITYDNYYGITKEKTPEQYQAFVALRLDDMLEFLAGTEDSEALHTMDFSIGARTYLQNGGMTDEEIDAFVDFLSAD